MKQVKSYNIFDSTELTDQEILEGYKKAEPSIKALRITELSFWITIFIVTIALDLYFSEGNGH